MNFKCIHEDKADTDTKNAQLETVEAFYAEPGYMKFITNKRYLTAHLKACHQYINYQICGSKQLRKNIELHLYARDKEEHMLDPVLVHQGNPQVLILLQVHRKIIYYVYQEFDQPVAPL
nr:transcription factor IIIA-like [Tanacetum cinerariifolium]